MIRRQVTAQADNKKQPPAIHAKWELTAKININYRFSPLVWGEKHIKLHTSEVKIITMLKIRHFLTKIITHKEEFQGIINLKFTEKLRE